MARKLGEVLIETGTVSQREMAEALRSQRIFGGTLGTHLLQLGFIDEQALAGALGQMHGVAVADRQDLVGAPDDVVGLLSPDFIHKHSVLPFRVRGDDLLLAMRNPADADVIREASFLSGHNVVPHLALEAVMRVELPRRVPDGASETGASASRSNQPVRGQDLPAENAAEKKAAQPPAVKPPSPKLPSAGLRTQDIEIPTTLIAAAQAKQAASEAAGAQHQAVTTAESRSETVNQPASMTSATAPAAPDQTAETAENFDTAAAARPAAGAAVAALTTATTAATTQRGPLSPTGPMSPPSPPSPTSPPEPPMSPSSSTAVASERLEQDVMQAQMSAATGPIEAEPESETPVESELDLEQIGRSLGNARDRDGVLDVALMAICRLMPRAAVFAVRKDQAILWKSFNMPKARAGETAVNLTRSSALAAVRERASFQYGPLANTPENKKLFANFGGDAPKVALVVPVEIRNRAVVVLYGDSEDESRPSPDFSRLGRLASLITMALEAVILRAKILRESGVTQN